MLFRSNVENHKEEKIRCGLALCAIKDKDEWYIDSGCSHYMTGDKSKMESLKKNQDGKVILSNDAPSNILGKGRAIINKNRRAVDTLLVQGLKQNLLSVGQMEDKGNIIVFTSTKCKVMDKEIGEVIARGYKNNDKLYVFKDLTSHRCEEDSDSD